MTRISDPVQIKSQRVIRSTRIFVSLRQMPLPYLMM